MKITKITSHVLGYDLPETLGYSQQYYKKRTSHIVEVETDEGVTGWGECFGPGNIAFANKGIVEKVIQPIVLGMQALDRDVIWHKVYNLMRDHGQKGMPLQALSGVDIALWDIKAKLAKIPLYKLLGGFSNKVDTYIAGGYYEEGKGLNELYEEMIENVKLGAKAVKIKVGAVPINQDIERVKICREAIGPDIKLMLDANNAYKHYEAIEFARKAEKYDIFWFEEPVEPDDYIGQREITRSTSIPIAAGENEYTRYGFRDLINHRAVDILQPDALIMGGITEFMKVVALAQSNDLDIAPHGAQEVHIHLVSAISNGLILEYYRDTVNPMHGKIWENELEIKDGQVFAPDRPGIGLEPKWDTLEPYSIK